MNEALALLKKQKPATPLMPVRRDPARLIFALDLTGSREHSLQQARIATAGMFEATTSIGPVQVQLVYYRGVRECQASDWQTDPRILSQWMWGLRCEGGETQIARVLRFALAAPGKISAVVFIGDHCEDNPATLHDLARGLGQRSRPIFVFHECADHDPRSLAAKPVFKHMAEASGGIYVEFKPDSAAVLRELLSSIAAFSAAGTEGIQLIAPPQTLPARLLQSGLLLLGSGEKR
jgi:hypothetical protein